METLPMGKILVARVQRREEPYAIVLFDTSTSEDINLNEKVFESVAQHLVEPSLPPVSALFGLSFLKSQLSIISTKCFNF